MPAIQYVSRLPRHHREELEALLFFNPNQSRVHAGIRESIARYGSPAIEERNDALRLSLPGLPDLQTLFALDGSAPTARLAGVVLYSRTQPDTLTVAHLAVSDDYANGGPGSETMLAMRLITKLRQIAHQIKGIRSVVLLYGGDQTKAIPI